MQKAAALMQFSAGSMGQKLELIEQTTEGGELAKYSQEIAHAVVKNNLPAAAPQLAGASIDDIAQKKYDSKERTLTAIKDEGRFTSESMAGMNPTALKQALEVAKTDPEAMEVLKGAVEGIDSNRNLKNKIQGNSKMEELTSEIRSWTPPPPAANPTTTPQPATPNTPTPANPTQTPQGQAAPNPVQQPQPATTPTYQNQNTPAANPAPTPGGYATTPGGFVYNPTRVPQQPLTTTPTPNTPPTTTPPLRPDDI